MTNTLKKFRSQLLIGTFLFCSICYGQKQDFSKNYELTTCKGEIPKQLKTKTLDKIKSDIANDRASKKDLKINTKFYRSYRYAQNQILKGGKILFGDEMTVYVNKVANKLLEKSGNESLKKELNFYVIKSDIVNAVCMPDGTIFITVGLLSQIENEAQLAFVIAHEITHYLKQHGINDYRDAIDLTKEYRKSDMTYKEAIEKLSDFSKDNELESDEEGYQMFVKAGYDSEEANKMLLVLQYSHLPFDEVKFDSKFFNRDKYAIPSDYFSKKSLTETIEDNSDEDDTYSTHPNIETRVEQLNEKKAKKGVKFFLSEDEFKYINVKARFENQYLHLIDKNFVRAIYESYLLKQKYPENKYLDECIAKGLYGVSKVNTNNEETDYESEIEEGNLSQLYTLFNTTMENVELNILAQKMLYELNDDRFKPFIKDLTFDLVKLLDFEYDDFIFDLSEIKADDDLADFKLLSDEEYDELTKVQKIKYTEKKKKYNAINDTTGTSSSNSEYYKTAFYNKAEDTAFKAMFDEVEEEDDVRFFSDLSYTTQRRLNLKREKETYKFVPKVMDSILIFTPNYESYDKKNELEVEKSLERQEKLSTTVQELSDASEVSYKNLNLTQIENISTTEINKLFILNEWRDEMNESYQAEMLSLTQDRANKVFEEFGYDHIMLSGVYTSKSSSGYLGIVALPMVTVLTVPMLTPIALYLSTQPDYSTYKYVRVLDKEGYVIFNKKLVSNDKANIKQDELFFEDVFNQIVLKK